jgi:hypothetical protein
VLLLIVATWAVYSVTAGFQLLNTLDDKFYLILNDTVTAFTAHNIKQAFSGFYVGNYAPVHIISYMIDYSLWGLHSTGYHLENVVLHLFNALLFYLLLRRLLLSEWYAAAAAWIFLFHPVQVESVAWVSQRKNLLAMFFFLLALLGYQSYVNNSCKKTRFYLLSLLSITVSMLSKSVAVIFPAVLILYDLAYLRKKHRYIALNVKDKLPYILIAAAVVVMTMISQTDSMGGGRREYPGGSPLSAFYTMVPVLLSYIKDCFWPFELSPFYMVTIRQSPDVVFVLSMIALAVVFALGIFLSFKSRPILFWFGLFFVALLPVLQFVPIITLKNDRYLYFSILGFSVLMVNAVEMLLQFITPKWKKKVLCVILLLLLALPALAFKQTLNWKNDVTIWSLAINENPENRLAWLQLAKGYTDRGDAANAIYAINRYNELRNKYGPVRGYEDQ